MAKVNLFLFFYVFNSSCLINTLSWPNGHSPSIFQSEVYAITVFASEYLRRQCRRKRICIRGQMMISRLMLEFLQTLNELGRHNDVRLIWVPARFGVEGYRRAGYLANSGARRTLVGLEPFCGVPRSHINRLVSQWPQNKADRPWKQCSGQRQVNRLKRSSGRARKLLELRRSDHI